LQYVYKNYGFEYFPQQVDDREDIYLMGRMHQSILGITLRAEYYFTPEISVQYYGNPYFSTVDYLEFRKVINSKVTDINERFYFFSESELQFNQENNTIQVNEISGDSYEFENPDVSFGEFRSNFVFRWEYKLGSVFYLVWSHNQGKYDNIDRPRMNSTIDELFRESSGDVIMAKLSYWFNM